MGPQKKVHYVNKDYNKQKCPHMRYNGEAVCGMRPARVTNSYAQVTCKSCLYMMRSKSFQTFLASAQAHAAPSQPEPTAVNYCMVHNPKQGWPKKQHFHKEGFEHAIAEAKRIAEACPGEVVYVLQPVLCFLANKPEAKAIKIEKPTK